MRSLFILGFYLFSITSFGQNIYSSQNEFVVLGTPLENVLNHFKAKIDKSGTYHNKEAGYSFGMNKLSQLEWFSTNKAAVKIGDGSIRCGMLVQDIKVITTKQQNKKIKLFGNKFLFITGLDNFPNTEFVVFLKDKSLAKKLRNASETPYRTDNGIYTVPLDLIPNNLKINSIRVTQNKI